MQSLTDLHPVGTCEKYQCGGTLYDINGRVYCPTCEQQKSKQQTVNLAIETAQCIDSARAQGIDLFSTVIKKKRVTKNET